MSCTLTCDYCANATSRGPEGQCRRPRAVKFRVASASAVCSVQCAESGAKKIKLLMMQHLAYAA